MQLPAPPWHAGRCALIPDRDWQLVLVFARQRDPVLGDLLAACAKPDNVSADTRVRMAVTDVQRVNAFVRQLVGALQHEPGARVTHPETSESEMLSTAHRRMAQALASVIEGSVTRREAFHAWVD